MRKYVPWIVIAASLITLACGSLNKLINSSSPQVIVVTATPEDESMYIAVDPTPTEAATSVQETATVAPADIPFSSLGFLPKERRPIDGTSLATRLRLRPC